MLSHNFPTPDFDISGIIPITKGGRVDNKIICQF